ncbi:MAG: hypothetical protein HY905_20285 [Deltaproteobacteria bacterium]|nr:hypothetical protein [Deltaproteobacteria bacterium]
MSESGETGASGPPVEPTAPAGERPAGISDLSLGLGIALFSLVLLAYEVVQIRVFAYSVNPAFVWSVIAITMLGFGVAGTVLSLSERLRQAPLGPVLAVGCVGFALAGLAANALFARTSHLMHFESSLASTFTFATIAVVILSTLPYAFGGFVVGSILSRRTEAVGRLYAFNLVGSAAGCFAVNFLLRPLGAERLVLLLLAVGAASAGLFVERSRRTLRWGVLGAGVLLSLTALWAPSLLPFQPDAKDGLVRTAEIYREHGGGEPIREWEAWDPIGKIDITSWRGQSIWTPDPLPFKGYTQDGGASSVLVGLGAGHADRMKLFDDTVYGVVHQLRPRADTLVIGLGGGPDIQCALQHGARSVVGVEINRSAAEAVQGPFSRFVGDAYNKPNVQILVQDGRSYARATKRRFDVMQMSGTDTLTVQSSGSFVMAESYLYTVEAFQDYLRLLKPDGMLAIVRFGAEPYRLGAIATTALRNLGVARPDLCVVVLSQARMKLSLVKKLPFTPGELDAIDRIVMRSAASNEGIAFPPYDIYGLKFGDPLVRLYAPDRPGNEPEMNRLFAAIRDRQDLGLRVVPTDDRPFYFAVDLVNYFTGGPVNPAAGAQVGAYMRFMGILVAIAVVLIVVPLLAFRARKLRSRGALPALAYFFLIGVCFMLLEVGLLQKSVLIVEHPAYSVSVVLASLLLSSALGSWLSSRLRLSPRAIVGLAAAVIGVVGGAYVLFLTPLFNALLAWPFALRMAAVVVIVAPLGTAMGMFFPTGLRRLGEGGGPLAPWAYGVNGFASVLGTVLSMPLAVLFGFTTLFALAVGAYLLAAVAFLGFPRQT